MHGRQTLPMTGEMVSQRVSVRSERGYTRLLKMFIVCGNGGRGQTLERPF